MMDLEKRKFGPLSVIPGMNRGRYPYCHSINLLKNMPAKTWITGHETGVFEGDPRQLFDDYLAVIQSREDKLLDFLKHPRSMQEIIGAWILYGRKREPAELYEFGERLHMQKHLDRLMATGKVNLENGKYSRIN